MSANICTCDATPICEHTPNLQTKSAAYEAVAARPLATMSIKLEDLDTILGEEFTGLESVPHAHVTQPKPSRKRRASEIGTTKAFANEISDLEINNTVAKFLAQGAWNDLAADSSYKSSSAFLIEQSAARLGLPPATNAQNHKTKTAMKKSHSGATLAGLTWSECADMHSEVHRTSSRSVRQRLSSTVQHTPGSAIAKSSSHAADISASPSASSTSANVGSSKAECQTQANPQNQARVAWQPGLQHLTVQATLPCC